MYGLTVIPLYDTLGKQNIKHVLNTTGCYNMFSNKESVNSLLQADDLGRLNTIIAFDEITEE